MEQTKSMRDNKSKKNARRKRVQRSKEKRTWKDTEMERDDVVRLWEEK